MLGLPFRGDSTLSTVIEGQGAANTVLHRPVGGLYYFLNIAAAGAGCSPSVPLIAKNLKLWSPSTKSVSVGAGGGAVFNNCTLGDTNSSNPVLTVNPSGITTVNDCLLVGNTTGGDIVSGGGFSANYSVFVNGYRSIYGTDGSLGVSLINNTFYGYTYRALEIPADMTVQAVIKNNIMIGNPITVYPIVDYSGLTETGVDYNWYSHANSNVTDGGHSITGTDPKFTNAAGDDFSLLSNSPVIGAAVNLCSTLVTATDVAGNPVCGGGAYVGEGSAPSIGAYNYTYSSGVLQAPVALGATSIIATGFTADWGATTGASGYALDVSVDSGFGTFVAGYNNMDVGNVTAAPVTGLTPGTQYYYRVRAYNGFGTSGNSNTSSCTTSTATSTLQATLTVDITGSGSVTSNPSVISCTNGNGVCGASFGDGTVVALTPAASAGFVFSGWSGGGCTTGTCQLTVTADTTVTAGFTPLTFTVTATVNGGSGGVAPSSSAVAYGSSLTVTITPGTGYTLGTFTDNGASVNATPGSSGTFTYTIASIAANHGVVATFSPLSSPVPVPALGLSGLLLLTGGLLIVGTGRRKKSR